MSSQNMGSESIQSGVSGFFEVLRFLGSKVVAGTASATTRLSLDSPHALAYNFTVVFERARLNASLRHDPWPAD